MSGIGDIFRRYHGREEQPHVEEREHERVGNKLARVSGKMVKGKPGDPKLTKATFGKVRG